MCVCTQVVVLFIYCIFIVILYLSWDILKLLYQWLQLPGDKVLGLAKFFLGIGIPGSAKDFYYQIDALACLENTRLVFYLQYLLLHIFSYIFIPFDIPLNWLSESTFHLKLMICIPELCSLLEFYIVLKWCEAFCVVPGDPFLWFYHCQLLSYQLPGKINLRSDILISLVSSINLITWTFRFWHTSPFSSIFCFKMCSISFTEWSSVKWLFVLS